VGIITWCSQWLWFQESKPRERRGLMLAA